MELTDTALNEIPHLATTGAMGKAEAARKDRRGVREGGRGGPELAKAGKMPGALTTSQVGVLKLLVNGNGRPVTVVRHGAGETGGRFRGTMEPAPVQRHEGSTPLPDAGSKGAGVFRGVLFRGGTQRGNMEDPPREEEKDGPPRTFVIRERTEGAPRVVKRGRGASRHEVVVEREDGVLVRTIKRVHLSDMIDTVTSGPTSSALGRASQSSCERRERKRVIALAPTRREMRKYTREDGGPRVERRKRHSGDCPDGGVGNGIRAAAPLIPDEGQHVPKGRRVGGGQRSAWLKTTERTGARDGSSEGSSVKRGVNEGAIRKMRRKRQRSWDREGTLRAPNSATERQNVTRDEPPHGQGV